MKVLIIEDEITASKKLESILKKLDPFIEVVEVLESVEEAVKWLNGNPSPDLGFFDIQLSDDVSFEIFDRVKVQFPIVFVTAYDDYLLKAFDHNSIHYLLKPINEDKLRQVLKRFRLLENHFLSGGISKFLQQRNGESKSKRLIVRKGVDYCPLEAGNIAYVFTEHKISFVRDIRNEIYMADQTLSEIEGALDKEKFFRVNRQYIVNIDAVVKFRTLEQSKIRLELNPAPKEEVIIGKERASEFRAWIKGR